MDRRNQTIEQFVRDTDFMAKLKAALENIEQGRGFAVFEGLQKKGTCNIAITFDGKDSLYVAALDLSSVKPEVRIKQETPKNIESKPERSAKK
jgi:hypothetical protein